MSEIEIVLLIIGGIIFIISFFLPARKSGSRGEGSGDVVMMTQDEIKLMVEKEIDDAKTQVSEIVDETVTYAMEKGERAMERITNEKIMAVNEYSDTVLKEIHKNQQEVVFLYDMLNNKHNDLLESMNELNTAAKEAKQAAAKQAQEVLVQDEAQKTETGSDTFNPFTPPQINLNDQRILSDQPIPDAQDVNGAATRNIDVQFGNSTNNSRNSNEIILEMHKEGKTNMAIARTLGLGISEVKLVIDLFEEA